MCISDETDSKILEMLQDNARTSFKKIAKKVGNFKAPVYNRIKKWSRKPS